MRTAARSPGFTLLELLAAAAVTVLLVGLILAVTTGALGLWRRTQGGFTMGAEAALALDLLERDLQGALEPATPGSWLIVSLTDEPATLVRRGWHMTGERMKPTGPTSRRPRAEPDAAGERRIAEARFGLSGTWLRLLTTTAESTSEAALPRAVSWQIARRPVTGPLTAANPAPVRYTLFRSALGAAATFANGYDLAAAAYSSPPESPGATRAPSTLSNPSLVDALAANVVDLGVWLFHRRADGTLVRIFPEAVSETAHAANRAHPDSRPDVAEVMLRVLTDEGARQLGSIETGSVTRPPGHASDAEWWWAVVEANSRVFVRRVELKGGGR